MPSNFSIQSILGIKEPEVVVLASDSETDDNEAEVNKSQMTHLETTNDHIQMVEVGLFLLDCFLNLIPRLRFIHLLLFTFLSTRLYFFIFLTLYFLVTYFLLLMHL